MPSKPWQRRWALTEAAVLEQLSSLIEKSFVTRLGPAANARYRLHETMREYALIKLREAEEEPAAIKAFVGFYADMCQGAEKAAQSPQLVELAQTHGRGGRQCACGARSLPARRLTTQWASRWSVHCCGTGRHGPPVRARTGWICTSKNREADDTDDAAMARALFARGFVSMVLGDATTAGPLLMRQRQRRARHANSPLLARILSVSAGIRVMSGELEGGTFATSRSEDTG